MENISNTVPIIVTGLEKTGWPRTTAIVTVTIVMMFVFVILYKNYLQEEPGPK